ncbi:MAG: PAS domain S-box protein [Pseudomonadota bacterium]
MKDAETKEQLWLRQSELKARAVFDQTFEFIGLMTADGTLVEANRAALEFAGIALSDVMNKPFWLTPWWTHSAEEQEKLRRAIKRVAEGEFVRFETTHIAQDGTLHVVDFSLKPVKDEAGVVILMVPEGRDITERKKIEEALRESKERLKNIIASAQDAIMTMDNSGNIVGWNRAAEKIFGYSEKEVRGKELHYLLAPERYHGAYRKAFPHFQKTGKGAAVGKTLELAAVRRDGAEFPIELSLSAFQIEGRWCAMGIMRDITARKKQEKELKSAYLKLSEAQARMVLSAKMAALGVMVSGVAHEISNPLCVISGEAQMLSESKNKELSSTAKTITEQAERILGVVQKISDFSRPKKIEPKPLDVNEIAKGSIAILRRRFKPAGIKIADKFARGIPKFLGDKNQIQEVLSNIMQNAVDAMGEKGTLTVRTCGEKVAEAEAKSKGKFEAGQRVVIVEIKDTGKGMAEKVLRRIFEPFFTTKPKGVGLGLSICYGIIDNHGGVIEAESRLGKGSTFRVKLLAAEKREGKWPRY